MRSNMPNLVEELHLPVFTSACLTTNLSFWGFESLILKGFCLRVAENIRGSLLYPS